MKTASAVAVGALFLVVTARADSYPVGPEEQDKLCEAIGETPNIAVPPRDRLWLTENCTCMEDLGCGKSGSKRWLARIKAQVKRLRAEESLRRNSDERVKAVHAETDELYHALIRCDHCVKAAVALEEACTARGLTNLECFTRPDEDKKSPEERAAEEERWAEAKAAQERRLAKAEEKKRAQLKARLARVAPARKATAELRKVFWLCSDGSISQDCNAPAEQLEAACKRHGLRVAWDSPSIDECYLQE